MKKFLLIFGLLMAYTLSARVEVKKTIEKQKYLDDGYIILKAEEEANGTVSEDPKSWPLAEFEALVTVERSDTNYLTPEKFYTKINGYPYMIKCQIKYTVDTKIKCSFSPIDDTFDYKIQTGKGGEYVIDPFNKVILSLPKAEKPIAENVELPKNEGEITFDKTKMFLGICTEDFLTFRIAGETTGQLTLKQPFEFTLTEIAEKPTVFCQWDDSSYDLICQAITGKADEVEPDVEKEENEGEEKEEEGEKENEEEEKEEEEKEEEKEKEENGKEEEEETAQPTGVFADGTEISLKDIEVELPGGGKVTIKEMEKPVVFRVDGCGGFNVYLQGGFSDLTSFEGSVIEQDIEVSENSVPKEFQKLEVTIKEVKGNKVTVTFKTKATELTDFTLKFEGLPTAECVAEKEEAICTIPRIYPIPQETVLKINPQTDESKTLFIQRDAKDKKEFKIEEEVPKGRPANTLEYKEVLGFPGFVSQNYIEFRLTPKEEIKEDLAPIYLTLRDSNDVVLCTPLSKKEILMDELEQTQGRRLEDKAAPNELVCKGKLTNRLKDGQRINYERYSDSFYKTIEPMQKDFKVSAEIETYKIYDFSVIFREFFQKFTICIPGLNHCAACDRNQEKCLELVWGWILDNGVYKFDEAKSKLPRGECTEGKDYCSMCGFSGCIECEEGLELGEDGKCKGDGLKIGKTEALFGQCAPYYFNFVLASPDFKNYKGQKTEIKLQMIAGGKDKFDAQCQWHWKYKYLICQANPQGLEGTIPINFEKYESPLLNIEPLKEPLVFKDGFCATNLDPWGDWDFLTKGITVWKKDMKFIQYWSDHEIVIYGGGDGEEGKGKGKNKCDKHCLLCSGNKCYGCEWWYYPKNGKCKKLEGIMKPKPKDGEKGPCVDGENNCQRCGYMNYFCEQCKDKFISFGGVCYLPAQRAALHLVELRRIKLERLEKKRVAVFALLRTAMKEKKCDFPLFFGKCLVCKKGFQLDNNFVCRKVTLNIVQFTFKANPFQNLECDQNKGGIVFKLAGGAEPAPKEPTEEGDEDVEIESSKEIKNDASFTLPMDGDNYAKCTLAPQGDTDEPNVDCVYSGEVTEEKDVSADTDDVTQASDNEDREESDEEEATGDGESESETTDNEENEENEINGPKTQRLRRVPVIFKRKIKVVYGSGLSHLRFKGFDMMSRQRIHFPVCKRPEPTPRSSIKYFFSHVDGLKKDTTFRAHKGYKFFSHAMTRSIIRISNFITMKVILKKTAIVDNIDGMDVSNVTKVEVETKCEPINEVDGQNGPKSTDFECYTPIEEGQEFFGIEPEDEGLKTALSAVSEQTGLPNDDPDDVSDEEEEEEGATRIRVRRLASGVTSADNMGFGYAPSTMARAALANPNSKYFYLSKLTEGQCNRDNSYSFTALGEYKDYGKSKTFENVAPLDEYEMNVLLGNETYVTTCTPIEGSSKNLSCLFRFSHDIDNKVIPEDFSLMSKNSNDDYFLKRNDGNEAQDTFNVACPYIQNLGNESSGGLSGGAIAAIVIASVVVVAAAAFLILHFGFGKFGGKKSETSADVQNTNSAVGLNE